MLGHVGLIFVIVLFAILKFYISVSTTATTIKQRALILVNFVEYDLVSSTRPFNLIMNSSIRLNLITIIISLL